MTDKMSVHDMIIARAVDLAVSSSSTIEDLLNVSQAVERQFTNVIASTISTMSMMEREGTAKEGAARVYHEATMKRVDMTIKAKIALASKQFKFNNPFDTPVNEALRNELLEAITTAEGKSSE